MSGRNADDARARPAGLATSIDHVVVVVHDLDAALRTFSAVFGEAGGPEGGAETGYRRAMFELGTSGQRIELCQPLAEDEPGGQSQASRSFRRRLAIQGEGVHNVALIVQDVEAAHAAVDAAGLAVIESRHSDSFFLHPRDMSGALLQLMTLPPEDGDAGGTG